MNSIISVLVAYNQFLLAQIHQLLLFIVKNIPIKSPKYDVANPKYNNLTVDRLPIIKKPEKLDYKQLLRDYKSKHGKELKPVKSRGKNPVPPDVVCHRCGAPHYTSMTIPAAVVSFCARSAGLGSTRTRKILKSWPWSALIAAEFL